MKVNGKELKETFKIEMNFDTLTEMQNFKKLCQYYGDVLNDIGLDTFKSTYSDGVEWRKKLKAEKEKFNFKPKWVTYKELKEDLRKKLNFEMTRYYLGALVNGGYVKLQDFGSINRRHFHLKCKTDGKNEYYLENPELCRSIYDDCIKRGYNTVIPDEY